jgi:hypothetical protein
MLGAGESGLHHLQVRQRAQMRRLQKRQQALGESAWWALQRSIDACATFRRVSERW